MRRWTWGFALVAAVVAAAPAIVASPAQAAVPRVMVVGDSISMGSSGDYTWRYRLHRHLAGAGVPVDMVGPRQDLYDNVAGVLGDHRYADPLFDRDHAAVWGRTAFEEKDTVGAEVAAASPDYLLVLMGVNDLIYRTDGAGAEAALRALIRNARASKPSIRIVLGTVLPTRRAGLDPAFAAEVADLNRRIPVLASTLSTARSPIAVAATATGFVAASDTYDGLHPNARGELKIAAAFADALATRFKLGPVHQRPLPVVPVGPRTPPTLRATGGDGSAVLRWSESPGATAYWLWIRNVTAKSSWQRQPTALTLTRRPWTLRGANGATYHVFLQTAKGYNTGVYSNLVAVRPHAQLAPAHGTSAAAEDRRRR